VNARIEALVKQVEKVRWLSPEAGEGELPGSLRSRVEERVVAFGEALRLADPDLDAPTCRIVRCAEEMCAAFLTAWSAAADQRDSWRFQEALRRANAARWMESDEDLRDWREAIDRALAASIERSDALRMGAPVSDPPFVRIARSELGVAGPRRRRPLAVGPPPRPVDDGRVARVAAGRRGAGVRAGAPRGRGGVGARLAHLPGAPRGGGRAHRPLQDGVERLALPAEGRARDAAALPRGRGGGGPPRGLRRRHHPPVRLPAAQGRGDRRPHAPTTPSPCTRATSRATTAPSSARRGGGSSAT
jgi:hypothetical protein